MGAPLYAVFGRGMADNWAVRARRMTCGHSSWPSSRNVPPRSAPTSPSFRRPTRSAVRCHYSSHCFGPRPRRSGPGSGCWRSAPARALNLLLDRYRFVGRDWSWGPAESPVRFDVDGGAIPVVPIEIVRSFVWPDTVKRCRRLEGALDEAARRPVRVDRSAATPWLRERLAEPVDDDVLTVVWHSVVWQYLESAARREADEVIAAAAGRMRLVQAGMEPGDPSRVGDIHLTVTTYDTGRPSIAVLARPHPHGRPVRLTSDGTS